MAGDGETRRLAAIMASDVVGYTALMGTDEAGTLSALRTLRKDLWEPKVAEHGGRIVKLTGDGQLTEFPSVADAVQCAVEVQRAMARRNADIPESHRIVLRVGINLGDVIIEGEDIYGDGVNVAARLEAIAPPGGIAISRSVRDQIRDKLLYALEDMGEQELKGVARPVRVFRVSIEDTGDGVGAAASAPPPAKAPPAATAAPTNRLWQGIAGAAVVIAIAAIYVVTIWQPWVTRVEAANVANMAFPLPDKPSIAVLPFVNLSGDPDQEFLADGISEDITTALSKLPRLFVISRTTTQTYKGRSVTVAQIAEDLGVQFVLEGSVQRDGDSLRVTAQLIDALSGRHIWADRYDRDINDLFAVKDEITLNVVSNVGAELVSGQYEKVVRNETNSLEAWQIYREGHEKLIQITQESVVLSREYFERAIDIDPTFVSAYTVLATSYRMAAQLGWSDPGAAIQKAEELYARALELDPDHAYTHANLSTLFLVKRDVPNAVASGERGVLLDPNNYVNHGLLGFALVYAGRTEEAIQHLEFAMRLSPTFPDWVLSSLGEAQTAHGDFDAAESTWDGLLERSSSATFTGFAHTRLALIYSSRALEDLAGEAIEKAVKAFPPMSIALNRRLAPFMDQALMDGWAETWRRVGMPE